MTARRLALLLALALAPLASASRARAQQVGHTPETSPFRDLDHAQELTGFAGYFNTGMDQVGVAWRGGPMVGARYQIHLAGPASFMGRLAAVQSDRMVINPTLAENLRDVGDKSGTLVLADVGLEISLTGYKSWHGLSPVVNGSGGVVADFAGTDVGKFKFGTPFALTYGGGLRWIPGGRWQGRLDVSDYLYRIRYPDAFYRGTDDVPALLAATVPRSRWTNNGAFTIGLSYLFGR